MESDYQTQKKTYLSYMKLNRHRLSSISQNFQDDEDIITQAVQLNGSLLHCASARLKNNRKLVLTALKNNHFRAFDNTLVKSLPPEMLDDEQLMQEAIKEDYFTFYYMSERLKNKFSMNLAAVQANVQAMEIIHPKFKSNLEFMKQVIQHNVTAIMYAPPLMKDSQEIIEITIEKDPTYFYLASERLKSQEDICLKAIGLDVQNFDYVSPILAENSLFLIKAIQINPQVVKKIQPLLENNQNLLLTILETNPVSIKYMDLILYYKDSFVKAAFQFNPFIITLKSLDIKKQQLIQYGQKNPLIKELMDRRNFIRKKFEFKIKSSSQNNQNKINPKSILNFFNKLELQK